MEHTEQIECTVCITIQNAIVEHTIPFWTKIHDCINCGFKIMESEWNLIKVCEVCKKQVTELFSCENCDSVFCENCQAEYNQFTQIDYSCCKSCAENRKE